MSEGFSKTKFNAMLHEKCPQCQTGKMFKYKPFDILKFTEMNNDCPVCSLHFEIEPGFFWGAMYVSYALTTGMMLFLATLVYFIFSGPEFWVYITIIATSIVLSSPFVYRYSRVLMLYLFSSVSFSEKYSQK